MPGALPGCAAALPGCAALRRAALRVRTTPRPRAQLPFTPGSPSRPRPALADPARSPSCPLNVLPPLLINLPLSATTATLAQILQAHMVDYPFFTSLWGPSAQPRVVTALLANRPLTVRGGGSAPPAGARCAAVPAAGTPSPPTCALRPPRTCLCSLAAAHRPL